MKSETQVVKVLATIVKPFAVFAVVCDFARNRDFRSRKDAKLHQARKADDQPATRRTLVQSSMFKSHFESHPV